MKVTYLIIPLIGYSRRVIASLWHYFLLIIFCEQSLWCEIWGSCNGVVGYSGLLRYNTVWLCEWFPVFHRDLWPSSSVSSSPRGFCECWRWKHRDTLKCHEPLAQQRSIINQRTRILRFCAVNGNIDRCVAVDCICTAVWMPCIDSYTRLFIYIPTNCTKLSFFYKQRVKTFVLFKF